MADHGPLGFGSDGFLDLNRFPDGDPDTVLDSGALEEMREAISADQRSDSDVDRSFVDEALDDMNEIDFEHLLPPDSSPTGSDGPFDLSEYEHHHIDDGDIGPWADGRGLDGAGTTDEDTTGADESPPEDNDPGLGTYHDDVAAPFEELGEDTGVIEVDLLVDPSADHGWDVADEPVVADSFDGMKDDEWGNG